VARAVAGQSKVEDEGPAGGLPPRHLQAVAETLKARCNDQCMSPRIARERPHGELVAPLVSVIISGSYWSSAPAPRQVIRTGGIAKLSDWLGSAREQPRWQRPNPSPGGFRASHR
jgi:hypothetical protein